MKKKVLSILVCLLIATVALSGCKGNSGATTTPTSPIAQVQADVEALQTDVQSIKTQLQNIDNTNYSSAISTLQSQVSNIQSSISGIYTQINALPNATDYSGDIAELRADITSLANTVNTLSAIISTVKTQVESIQGYDDSIVRSDIEWISNLLIGADGNSGIIKDIELIKIELGKLDTIYATKEDFNTLYNNDLYLQQLINNLQSPISEPVSITRFEQGSAYMTFQAHKSGDYVAIVTLYGVNLDTVDITIPTGNNITLLSSNCYGTNATMRVLILEPKDIITTTSTIKANWTSGKVVEIDFTNATNIHFAQIAIGAR